MRAILAAATAMLAGEAAAQALTAEQSNILTHAANAVALEERCPVVRVQWPMLTLALELHGIAPADIAPGGRLAALASARIDEARLPIAGQGEDRVCALALFMYGPDGVNVRDLIRETP